MSTERRGLGKPIDVEPLAEPRWAHIEHALLDAERTVWAPEARPPEPVLSLRAAGALVLAATVAVVVGAFTVHALVQADLGTPTRVETAANGSHVEFGESTVDVGPESSVRLLGDDAHGVTVVVDRGNVECEVTPRHGRPPFMVQAGTVEVKVVGTHFVVARNGSKATVDVQHGQVEVSSGGSRWLVGPGAHWPATDLQAQAPTQALATQTQAQAPTQVQAPTPAQALTPAQAPTPTPASARSPRSRYEAASRLEAIDPDAALAQYRDLARQGGPWGQNALFAAGRLDADRGNRDESRRLLLQYLSLYPGGANANDARELLNRMR